MSTDRPFRFLVNPLSGGGAGPRVVVGVARALREAGREVEVHYTSHVDETPELVAAALAREAVVVAVGGDGMVSSVAGLVADGGGTLGLVPAGRGNDFARALGTPADPAQAAQVLLAGATRRVDLLEVTEPARSAGEGDGGGDGGAGRRLVVAGSVYTGVDARTAALVDRSRWMPARLQYPVATVAALATYRPVAVRVEVDGAVSEHRVATVVVANSAFYGKGMRIAPRADVADGELDVVVIEAAGRADLIRSLPKVYDGSHATLDEVTLLRGRRVRLSGALVGGAPSPVGADGEPLSPLPVDAASALEVQLLPGVLTVLG